jgi:tryptophan-rich sensory protein
LAAAELAVRTNLDCAVFHDRPIRLAVYAIQLGLSAAWTQIFIGLHCPGLGFLDIVLAWLSIAATICLPHPIHAAAA